MVQDLPPGQNPTSQQSFDLAYSNLKMKTRGESLDDLILKARR